MYPQNRASRGAAIHTRPHSYPPSADLDHADCAAAVCFPPTESAELVIGLGVAAGT